MEQLTIVKVGGKVLEDESSFSTFIQKFSSLEGKKLLVHGGGVLANSFLKRLDIVPQMLNGRRVTDKETLEVVTMVYGGLINKKVVARLIAEGIRAVGLTGIDGLTIESVKRPAQPVDYGYAGDVIKVNPTLLLANLAVDIVPVIAPLTVDSKGQILNTNADTMATEIARKMSENYEVNLIFGFEIAGVMEDIEDPTSLIRQLDHKTYEELKSAEKIHSGMIPKLDNAFYAGEKTNRTIIAHYENVGEVLKQGNDGFTEIIA